MPENNTTHRQRAESESLTHISERISNSVELLDCFSSSSHPQNLSLSIKHSAPVGLKEALANMFHPSQRTGAVCVWNLSAIKGFNGGKKPSKTSIEKGWVSHLQSTDQNVWSKESCQVLKVVIKWLLDIFALCCFLLKQTKCMFYIFLTRTHMWVILTSNMLKECSNILLQTKLLGKLNNWHCYG